MNIERLEFEYRDRKEKYLEKLVPELKKYISNILTDYPRIDGISVRSKDVDRFVKKAQSVDKCNKPKYNDPLNQIQDQLGARIITFYSCDIAEISKIIESFFRYIEKHKIVPDSVKEFGYEGQHYILFIPEDVIPDLSIKEHIPPFFELQIKTLFQHAWSEAEHDLGYKTDCALTDDEKRKMAFTAAQAWGADHIFNELFLNKR